MRAFVSSCFTIAALIAIAAVSLGAAGVSGQSTTTATWPPADIKLGYVNFGGVDDLGYSFSFNVARLKIHENIKVLYPNSNVSSYIEQNVFFMSPEGKKAALARLVARGCHVIVADAETLLHEGNYDEVSALYPNVTFISNTQPDRALFRTDLPNFLFVIQVPRTAFYLKGAAAAASATRCIGLIGAWEDRTNANDAMNGAILGIRDEKPNLPIHFVQVNNWYSPDFEVDAAEVMLTQLGCNVIVRYSDPRDVDLLVASKNVNGMFSVGPHSDLQRYVGDTVLVASYINWDIGLTPMIQRILNTGRPDFSGVPYIFGSDVVKTTELSPLASPEAHAAFERAKVRAASMPGIFCGPLTLRNGTVVQTSGCRTGAQPLDKLIQTPGLRYHGYFHFRDECAAGMYARYNSVPNISLSCIPCPANTFSIEAGQMACTRCPNGTTSDAGSTACHLVAAESSGPAAWLIAVIVILVVLVAVGAAGGAMAGRGAKANHDNAPKEGPLCLMFTDIESSTELWSSYPKDMAVAVETHHRIIREVIADYAGYEVKTVGDSFMIACASLVDGAMIAVAIQRQLQGATWPDPLKYLAGENAAFHGLKVRIGVHWCEEVEPKYEPERDYWDYYGNDVNIAARVESKARGGQILFSHTAFHALRSDPLYSMMVEPQIVHSIFAQGVELKGVAEPVTLYTVLPVELGNRTFEALEGYSPTEGKGGDHHEDSDTSTTKEGQESAANILTLGNILVVSQRLLSKCAPGERAKIIKSLASAWDPASIERPMAHALRSIATAAAITAPINHGGSSSHTASAQATPRKGGAGTTPRKNSTHPNQVGHSD